MSKGRHLEDGRPPSGSEGGMKHPGHLLREARKVCGRGSEAYPGIQEVQGVRQ